MEVEVVEVGSRMPHPVTSSSPETAPARSTLDIADANLEPFFIKYTFSINTFSINRYRDDSTLALRSHKKIQVRITNL